MIASRAPLPESSASEPSGLKIRNVAIVPSAPAGGSESSRMPSAATPVWGAQIVRIRPAVSCARERALLHDHVVVAERLPLLEVHAAGV